MKEEARKFLEKAERTLRAAETLSRVGDYESAAGRSYYAMLHAAQALLRERDLRYRTHAGVHGAFGEHFAKTGLLDPKYHRWLLDAFDDRLRSDYDIDSFFERDDGEAAQASPRVPRCRSHLPGAPRMSHDRRLIEDYLPIEAISTEASREKSVRKVHISTLHLWWSRRSRKAQKSTEACRLYVVRDGFGPDPELRRIQNPTVRLDHAKRESVAVRFFEIPAEAVVVPGGRP